MTWVSPATEPQTTAGGVRGSVSSLLRCRFGIEPQQVAGIEVYDRADIDEVFDELTGWDRERRGERWDGREKSTARTPATPASVDLPAAAR